MKNDKDSIREEAVQGTAPGVDGGITPKSMTTVEITNYLSGKGIGIEKVRFQRL